MGRTGIASREGGGRYVSSRKETCKRARAHIFVWTCASAKTIQVCFGNAIVDSHSHFRIRQPCPREGAARHSAAYALPVIREDCHCSSVVKSNQTCTVQDCCTQLRPLHEFQRRATGISRISPCRARGRKQVDKLDARAACGLNAVIKITHVSIKYFRTHMPPVAHC